MNFMDFQCGCSLQFSLAMSCSAYGLYGRCSDYLQSGYNYGWCSNIRPQKAPQFLKYTIYLIPDVRQERHPPLFYVSSKLSLFFQLTLNQPEFCFSAFEMPALYKNREPVGLCYAQAFKY